MTDSRVALGMDRLPWLPDEPVAAPRAPATAAHTVGLLGWAVAAMLAIAAASYWFGLATRRDAAPLDSGSASLQATVPLPPPAEPAEPATKPEPIVAPPIPIIVERPVIKHVIVERVVPAPAAEEPVTTTGDEAASSTAGDNTVEGEGNVAAEAAPPPPAKPVYTGPWPARVVEGASGRLVRVGAFRTARQAKKGWWAIVKVNPALKHLPALVVPVQSYRNGQVYYRLQMGTTSQAHSTVLCQRMRMIGQSCVVIDERRA
jgi:hypothetical protein